MATNQRENIRKSRKKQKEQKMRRIAWGIIILVAAILIVMKVVELDFNSIKKQITGDDGKLDVVSELEVNPYPFQLDSSKNLKLTVQSDKLDVITGRSFSVLNPKDAKVLYSFEHGYANPIFKTAGDFIVTYDQGTNRLRLDNLRKKFYEKTDKNQILCANVSKCGNVIYGTLSEKNKAAVCVLNTSMKAILTEEISSGYVVACAIDQTGKRCAYATVNTKDARLVTTVYTINVGDDNPRASFEFVGTDLLDLSYSGSDLYIIGNNCLSTVTSQKKQHVAFKQGSVNTVCFTYTQKGELLYVYSEYSAANENHLVSVTAGGKARKAIELKQRPKEISSYANEICLLYADSITVHSLSNGEKKNTYKCDGAVDYAYKLSSRIFVLKGQQVDVME